MSTKRSYLSKVVVEMPDSGIKDFFDIANTMDGALSLGVGEPDFQTPEHVREAAVASIRRAETKRDEKHFCPLCDLLLQFLRRQTEPVLRLQRN